MFGHIIVYRSYLSLSCSYLRLLDQTLNTVLTLALSLEICTFRILANYIGIPQISRGFQIPKKRRGTPSHYQTLNLPKFFSRSFPKFLGVKRKPRSVLDSKTERYSNNYWKLPDQRSRTRGQGLTLAPCEREKPLEIRNPPYCYLYLYCNNF